LSALEWAVAELPRLVFEFGEIEDRRSF
jgi:hypothetical protein